MANSQMRVPPHSNDAEVSVLGAILLDKNAVVDVAEFLKPEHFYDDRHQEIYEAMIGLYEDRSPIDVLTLSDRLTKRKSLKKVGGAAYLTELANRVPTAAHVEQYAKIVKDLATKRSLMTASAKLVDLSLDESMSAEELLDKAESHIFSLSQKHLTQGFAPVKAALADSFDRLDELHKLGSGLRGIPTGFKELDDLTAGFQKSNLIVLAGRPGGGKCVTGDSLIVDSRTGRREKISEITKKRKASTLSLDTSYKLKNTKPSDFIDNGQKPVWEITTALGSKLKATRVHPLLTIDGWKKVEELSVDDRIAVPRKMEVFGNKNWEDWQVKVLAYLIGDGGLTDSSPKFTNKNPKLLSDFASAISKFKGATTTLPKHLNSVLKTALTIRVISKDQYGRELRYSFSKKIRNFLREMSLSQNQFALNIGANPASVSSWVHATSLPSMSTPTYTKLVSIFGEDVEGVNRNNPVTVWLRQLGLMGILSIKKQLPDEVFELPKEKLSLFLNRLYACEGSAYLKERGTGTISFASSSYSLAEAVKHLLLRFGILAKLRRKNIAYRGKSKVAYEVEIDGVNDILVFAKEIGIFGKEDKIAKLQELTLKKQNAKNFSKDTLPMGVWKLVIAEKGNLSWREVYKLMGRPVTHNIHVNKRQLKRETLKDIALALGSKKLLELAESDVYWDRIVSIKPVGMENVYDLSIDKLHNFVVNDIVVHNSSFATNIAQHLAVNLKRSAAIFSLEMSKEELVDRLLVAQADIDSWKLKTGKLSDEDFSKLSTAMGELAEAPLFIDDQPAQTILEMRTKARRLQAEQGLDLLVVDYLQLARGKTKDNRVQEVAEISQGLKNLARELKIPVVALSQLNRSVESRDVKRPNLSDLRESGCLLGETLITLADTGERVKIENLVGRKDFKVLAMHGDFKVKPATVSKVFESGTKDVYELTLKSGKKIKASANHPFYTLFNWKRLDELKVGDRVATPREIAIKEHKYPLFLNENKVAILAHLIGDGCFVKHQPLHYTNSDMSLISLVSDKATCEFDIHPRVVDQQSWHHLYLSANQKLARGRRNPIVKWLDEDLHIYGLRSREKFVPEAIFQASRENIVTFLKNIWATDGCIYVSPKDKTKRKVTIYYASGSYRLASDISALLLRLGIQSVVGTSKKQGYQNMWIVNILGKQNQTKFLDEVDIVGKKQTKAKEAREFLASIKTNPNNDVVPKEIWNYIEEVRITKNLTTRQFHQKMGWAYSGTQRHGNGIGRARLKRIATLLDDYLLTCLAESDVYWDQVVDIKKIGKHKVYDMTVPGVNNFIANDIIVHNSIEQDADIVMFLWPENDDDRTQIVLDVAKHRNGALGQIKLYFKGERTKFYPRELNQKAA